ncbi:MAG: hypothetical protein K1X89_22765 [Myxococcaceae bacterium]|nr:hypothetical protein [Myxococcaceae bacterium]
MRAPFLGTLVAFLGCAPADPHPPSAPGPGEVAAADQGSWSATPPPTVAAPAAQAAPLRDETGTPVRPVAPPTLQLESSPPGARSVTTLRELKVLVRTEGLEPVVLELLTPQGIVFFRREAEPSDAGLTLLVAGTAVEQRQLWGTWTVHARQGERTSTLHFELER